MADPGLDSAVQRIRHHLGSSDDWRPLGEEVVRLCRSDVEEVLAEVDRPDPVEELWRRWEDDAEALMSRAARTVLAGVQHELRVQASALRDRADELRRAAS